MVKDKLMPAIFFGHGNPMNALLDTDYTGSWAAIGKQIPRPDAILCISAHWYVPATSVTAMASPETIHDFGGFPEALYKVRYPAPGNPDLAKRVKDLLEPIQVSLDNQWGLDHGTWSVLCRVFPDADIPVVQLSIDERQSPGFHYEAGKRLAPLRDEGVLVIGSGNVVHNLRAYRWDGHSVRPYNWALRFEDKVRSALVDGRDSELIEYEMLGEEALKSAPTPDHYLPLLYIMGLRRKNEPVSFPVEGIDGGSISMLAVQFG
jgi:4,5-DOPA dioxygenase extradiol